LWALRPATNPPIELGRGALALLKRNEARRRFPEVSRIGLKTCAVGRDISECLHAGSVGQSDDYFLSKVNFWTFLKTIEFGQEVIVDQEELSPSRTPYFGRESRIAGHIPNQSKPLGHCVPFEAERLP